MGKESTRTLKNITYNSKKNSKNSKKSKKNKNNEDPTTSDEMRQILDSESEVQPSVRNFLSRNNKLTPYNGDMEETQPFNGMGMPPMGGMGMQGMGGMGMQNQMMCMQGMGGMGMQNQLQMFSPSLHIITPVCNTRYSVVLHSFLDIHAIVLPQKYS